jgi:hypothetical protein
MMLGLGLDIGDRCINAGNSDGERAVALRPFERTQPGKRLEAEVPCQSRALPATKSACARDPRLHRWPAFSFYFLLRFHRDMAKADRKYPNSINGWRFFVLQTQ